MQNSINFPNIPKVCDPLEASQPNENSLAFLANRRSTPIKCLSGPGPSKADVEEILKIASRVPDHRKLEPWRFVVIDDVAGKALGIELAKIKLEEDPSMSDGDIQMEKDRFNRSPICIAVISNPDVEHKTPVWEQELSVGALCMNLLLTANAAGWAGSWLTEWFAFSAAFGKIMKLSETERFAGFIYLGTALQNPPERPRPNIADKTLFWT